METFGRARGVTHENTYLTQRIRIACWITMATGTPSEYVILLFHYNSGYANASQCYVVRTLCLVISSCHIRIANIHYSTSNLHFSEILASEVQRAFIGDIPFSLDINPFKPTGHVMHQQFNIQ